MAFSLGAPAAEVRIEDISARPLLDTLQRLDIQGGRGSIFNRRAARIYEVSAGFPTIYIAKPDEKRFWTRSMGLQDGDEVALDLYSWQAAGELIDEDRVH